MTPEWIGEERPVSVAMAPITVSAFSDERASMLVVTRGPGKVWVWWEGGVKQTPLCGAFHVARLDPIFRSHGVRGGGMVLVT